MARGSRSRARSPASPSGKRTVNVTSMSPRWFSTPSRILTPSAVTSNCAGSAIRLVMKSTSVALHAAIAVRKSSTGVKSAESPPPPTLRVPPRTFVTR